ncbi:MAG: hypothetical protein JXA90_09000 [Planctomycetes bacterium]|nr:hypothetical protein [Planctomycetota bacterium]
MAESVTVKAAGLYLQGNDIEAPEGALSVADNVVVSRDNIIELRRGFAPLGVDPALALSQILALYGAAGKGYYYSALTETIHIFNGIATWTPVATIYPVPSLAAPLQSVIPSFSKDGYTYFSSYRQEAALFRALDSDFQVAGAPPGLDMQLALSASPGSAVPDQTQVAYRVVWVQVTGSRQVPGAPSWRAIIANTSGSAKAVDITITVPQGFGAIGAATHLLQVYRSRASASATASPDDEMQLVLEQAAPASGVTVTVTDTVPDSLLQAALYTNESQEGATQASYRPPQAAALAMFKGCAFYGCVFEPLSVDLAILATGASGLDVGSVLHVTGNGDYTGAAAENIAARQFQVYSGGLPSSDWAATAASIIRCVNRDPSANRLVYAISTDTDDGPFGTIRLIGRTDGVILAEPYPAGVRVSTVKGGQKKNRLYWSKPSQPEAVPLVNFVDVGDTDAIFVLRPTRDTLFVQKGEEGIFRVVGQSGNFALEPFDRNTRLVAPLTAVALDNRVFCLSEQGAVAVNDNGVELISRPIETALIPLLAGDEDTAGTIRHATTTYANAVGYESWRKYILFIPSDPTDTAGSHCYVYDLITQAWTHWPVAARSAAVTPADDRLVLIDDDGEVHIERKDFLPSDYADRRFAVSIDSASGTELTVSDLGDGTPYVGDVLTGPLGTVYDAWAIVTAVSGNYVQVDRELTWELGPGFTYKLIAEAVEWAPKFAPLGKVHHFIEAALGFRVASFALTTFGFATDSDPSLESLVLSPGWQGEEQDHPVLVASVPRNKARGSLLRVRFECSQAWSPAPIQALSVSYSPGLASARRRPALPVADYLDATDLY